MPKVIIVEPGSSARYISNAIKLLGYEPVILCSISEYGGDHKKYIEDHGYFEVSAGNAENILKCIEENAITDILGVISTADRFISQACQVALHLGVKGMDPALLKLNNKAEVIRFIPEDSPPSIIFNKDNLCQARLKEMLKSTSALVVKPSMSAGAKGLFEITSEQGVDEIYASMCKETEVKVLDQDWIAQASISGTLFSLEGFVANGVINHIGVSRRSRIKYTESQNLFPADDDIEPETVAILKRVHEKLVQASGYKNGYYHTEIIFDGKKAFLIDANFGRVGGASISTQIAKSAGKETAEIYAHVIDVTFFGDKPSHAHFYPQKKTKTLSLMYGMGVKATLLELSMPKQLRSHHVRLADNGKVLNQMGVDNRSWIGILTGTPEEVLEEIDQVTINTKEGILKPVF